jgi:hypothetical protein
MRTFAFERELPYVSHKVRIPVTLLGAPGVPDVEMVIDTGAEISLLNRQFIPPLAVTVAHGEAITLETASGHTAPAWVHRVEVALLGRRMMIEAAFCPDWDTANLLGMRGFFDQMVVAFDHANRRMYF